MYTKTALGTGVILLFFSIFSSCAGKPTRYQNTAPLVLPPFEGELPVSSFEEIWTYVLSGREATLKKGLPISDIGYFGADIDSYGKLISIPDRKKLNFPARIHMVVKCDGAALTHFTLLPGSQERSALITDLLEAVKNFDGLQIDFENVPKKDGEAYLSFLKELRAGLDSGKMFTVALGARTKKNTDDVYDYEKILPVVDRILVMAYDQHWSGSKPGSIAELKWCKSVAEYAYKTIGREKLVMGIPFYGRAWGNHNPSRALLYSTTEGILKENEIAEIGREEGIPVFNYDVSVGVKVYYEDEYSLSARMELYKSMDIASIGFWRLGQETPEIWKYLKLEPAVENP